MDQSELKSIALNLTLPKGDKASSTAMANLAERCNAEKGIRLSHTNKYAEQTQIFYQPSLISLKQISELINSVGIKFSENYEYYQFKIAGMDCSTCAEKIQGLLNEYDGVLGAEVSYVNETIRLEINSFKVKIKNIKKHLSKFGYRLFEGDEPTSSWFKRNRELILSISSGVLLFFAWVAKSALGSFYLPIILLAFFLGGYYAFRDAGQALLLKKFDIDVLMVVAAIGAGIIGAWEEGTLLLFLFSLGHSLEHMAMDKARRSVKALANLAPKTAMVEKGEQLVEVPVKDLKLKDIVMVQPGQALPADGVVKRGQSAVNQAPITGESVPVDKNPNDEVYAGTINGEGVLSIEVTKLSDQSTLSRMARLVSSADTQHSPTQRFTNKFTRVFVPTVLIFAVLLIFIPPLIFSESWWHAIYRALTVLVAASPCALAIATPAAVLSGIGRSAQMGVLIKGGLHLENLGLTRTIAFDKTGTLTKGKLTVETVALLDKNVDEEGLIKLAASLEQGSEHPIAKAVLMAAKKYKGSIPKATDVKAVPGKGIRGIVEGKEVLIGGVSLFGSIPDTIHEQVNGLKNGGYTIMLIQSDGKFWGIIGISDQIRANAKDSLATLHKMGVAKTIMLTGDNQGAALKIAHEIGIDEVHAGLLPEDKLSKMKQLQKENRYIAMVGDGVNDAPAMAQSTVGIAMGGAGTDVALETADVALMSDDLSKLPFVIGLGRKARSVIQQNLWASLAVVAFLVSLSLSGLASIGFAVIVHEGSSILVVFNALRLLRFKT